MDIKRLSWLDLWVERNSTRPILSTIRGGKKLITVTRKLNKEELTFCKTSIPYDCTRIARKTFHVSLFPSTVYVDVNFGFKTVGNSIEMAGGTHDYCCIFTNIHVAVNE